jgi:Ras-related protein Rab-28
MSGLKSALDHSSSSDDEPEFLQYKLIVIGDGTVGKTSLCMKLCEGEFSVAYKQTIGLDFFIKRLELPQQTNVALQIWDIGGQSIGSQMLKTYISGAAAIVMVYDITNYDSFRDLEEWLQVVKEVYAQGSMPYIALVGNKTDLFHMQAVKSEVHNRFADQHSLYSYLVSAKTGDQVYNSFFRIAADIAGVVLTGTDIEAAQEVLKAEVVLYSNELPRQEEAKHEPVRHSESQAPRPQAKQQEPPAKKKKCLLF